MNVSQKLLWNIYAGAVGALSAVVAQKAVRGAWKVATGDEPPDPNAPLPLFPGRAAAPDGRGRTGPPRGGTVAGRGRPGGVQNVTRGPEACGTRARGGGTSPASCDIAT